jgi:hypothetical protein
MILTFLTFRRAQYESNPRRPVGGGQDTLKTSPSVINSSFQGCIGYATLYYYSGYRGQIFSWLMVWNLLDVKGKETANV